MIRTSSYIAIILIAATFLMSCGAGEDNPGRIFMPDMTYSTAQEVYAPYGSVKGDSISAIEPVKGTIPRGYMPYHYENNLDGYERAGAELVNPIKKTEENIAEGGRLYNIYCAPCHGIDGKGQGKITEKAIALQPPSYFDANIMDLPDGKMFHSIHYGKNMMGSYASQLSKDQRWMIIHYINQMQDATVVETAPEVVTPEEDTLSQNP